MKISRRMFLWVSTLLATATLNDVVAQSPRQGSGQSADGIYEESGNRLPLITRDSLDQLGTSIYDQTVEEMKSGWSLAGFRGPSGITLYSPQLADTNRRKNRYLRYDSHLGRRLSEIAILATARELNQQFEWTAHEPAALSAGVELTVIDTIKYRRPITGLSPVDAVVIQLSRQVLTQHSVDLATFREASRLLGNRDLVDVVSLIGEYAATAVLLNAFDQQLPPNQAPLLPVR